MIIVYLFACGQQTTGFEVQAEDCPEFDFDYTSNNAAELHHYRANMTFVGDIFWSRGVHRYLERKEYPYEYIFENLPDFESASTTWIGNLECPVVTKQVTYELMKERLIFSCQPEYLEGFKQYFKVVSLANNHTDNRGLTGYLETRDYLEKHQIQYFGHYDNAVLPDICEVVEIPVSAIDREGYPYIVTNPNEVILDNVPIAVCGYHGVYKLPKPEEIDVIRHYAEHFFTIAMPHQGREYELTSNKYQQLGYRAMIDAGADLVLGAHPHVVQDVERYNDRLIFYSLGNFVFDQVWEPNVRQGLVVNLDLELASEPEEDFFWDTLNCQSFQDDCVLAARAFQLKSKPFIGKLTPMVSATKQFRPTRAPFQLESNILSRINWTDINQYIQSGEDFSHDTDH